MLYGINNNGYVNNGFSNNGSGNNGSGNDFSYGDFSPSMQFSNQGGFYPQQGSFSNQGGFYPQQGSFSNQGEFYPQQGSFSNQGSFYPQIEQNNNQNWFTNPNQDTDQNTGSNPFGSLEDYLPQSPSVQYMNTVTDATTGNPTLDSNGKPQLDQASGLDYSAKSLASLDQKTYTVDGNGNLLSTNDKDNVISDAEAGPMGAAIDVDGDGNVNSGENLAYAQYQDKSNPNKIADGMVTSEEVDAANQAYVKDPTTFKNDLKTIYEDKNTSSGKSLEDVENAKGDQKDLIA